MATSPSLKWRTENIMKKGKKENYRLTFTLTGERSSSDLGPKSG
jgi:hypothetical protein